MVKRLILLILAASLVSCGFHWRGDKSSAVVFTVEGFTDDHPLLIAIQQNMQGNGAPSTLIQLQRDQWQRRVAAVADDAQAAEIEWRYQVWFRLMPIGAALPTTDERIVVSANYGYRSSQLLASDAEESLLHDELRVQAAQQIIARAEQWQAINIR